MSEETMRVVLQALSAFAYAGTLFYAALQFRGWRTSQRVANFTKLIELQLQLRSMNVNDPTLAALDPDAVPKGTTKEVRGYFYNLMQLSLFEIAWFSHRQGQLDEGYYESWVSFITSVVQRPSFQFMWASDRTKILDDRFRTYLDTLMSQGSNGAPLRPAPIVVDEPTNDRPAESSLGRRSAPIG